MDLTQILTGGGIGGLIVALGYLGRLALDAWREKRAAPREDKAASVTDAATANALLIKTLESLQAENKRQAAKIKHLEEEDVAKDRKIDELQRALADAQAQIERIATELASLKTRHA